MFRNCVDWLKSWRQPVSLPVHEVDFEVDILLSSENDEALVDLHPAISADHNRNQSISYQDHRADGRHPNNGCCEQSFNKELVHDKPPRKPADDAQLDEHVDTGLLDVGTCDGSAVSSSRASGQRSIKARDGAHSRSHLHPDIKDDRSDSQTLLEYDKGQPRLYVRQKQSSIVSDNPRNNNKAVGNPDFFPPGLFQAMPPDETKFRAMETSSKEVTESTVAGPWSPTATGGRRSEVHKNDLVSTRTCTEAAVTNDAQPQTEAGSLEYSTKREVEKTGVKMEHPLRELPRLSKEAREELARLSKEAREKLVAESAALQLRAQAVREEKHERYHKKYTKPLELVRETRSKAAEEMVRAAKADVLRKAAITGKDCPATEAAVVPTTRVDESTELETLDGNVSDPLRRPDTNVKRARKHPGEALPRNRKPSKADYEAAQAAKLAMRSKVVETSTTADTAGQSQKPVGNSWPLLLDAQGNRVRARVITYSRPAFKPKVPDVEEPEDEPESVEEPPTRQWKASDPALDPDSLIVRYAQLESTTVPELDREASRRLFKAKQAQLKKERTQNWWEQDEDAVPESDWQQFAREMHPGADASTEDLHQHYRMVHETVPLREKKIRTTEFTHLKFNKKHTLAVPTLEERSPGTTMPINEAASNE